MSKTVGDSSMNDAKKFTALVVDDTAIIRNIEEMLLNSKGFKTKVVENGQEAVKTFIEGNSFDVIIMDMEMPIMDGIQERTRSTPQQQPQLDLESVTGYPHVVFVPEFPNQKQRFIELSRRKVIPTRFFDRSLLSKLGIDSECKNLFAKLGMSQLFNMNYRTYEDLTLEFLSSFDIEKGRNGLVKYVVYRLLNRSHRMSLEGFARKFGLPCTGLTVQPSSFISGELWFAMTGENIESFQHALSHKIHQPVLRLWTRFTGWTIFGRIEPNNVRSDEISILGSYLRRGDEDGDFKMNIAHLFALHLKKQGTTYTTIKSNGERSNIPIVLGGLVTHLALREGFDEASRCPVPGPITLDQHYLTTAGWLSIDFNRFSWIIGRTNRLSVPLPSPDLTKIMPHQPSYLLQFLVIRLPLYQLPH
uniref:Response regulatory domain-containing protein n=1 Tax=Chenopodium quinoa TaxID=63459 RepID=A0A803NEB5_CHEQI